MRLLPFPELLRSHDTVSAADAGTSPVPPSASANPAPEPETLPSEPSPELPDHTGLAPDFDSDHPPTGDSPQLAATAISTDVPPAQLETRNSKPETLSPRRRHWKKFVRRGRPSVFTEDVADAMYEAILDCGVSDSRAGLLARVSTSSVSRWKQEDPEFADFLETARIEFESEEIKKIRHAKRRDGQPNAQNSKWLLERTNPEVWGPRRRGAGGESAQAGRVSAKRPPTSPHAAQAILRQENPQTAAPQTHSATESYYADSSEGFAPDDPEKAAIQAWIAEMENARFHAAQQSKNTQNIPEIHAAASATQLCSPSDASTHEASSGPSDTATSGESLTDNEAQTAAILAYVAEAESAFSLARQQSKCSSNIPEITPPTPPSSVAANGIELVLPNEVADRVAEECETLGTPETSPKPPFSPACSASSPDPVSQRIANAGSIPEVAPLRRQSRKQLRREAHLARRTACKAARAAHRSTPPAMDANVAQAASPADLTTS